MSQSGRLALPRELPGGELLIAGLDLDDRAADGLTVTMGGIALKGRFTRRGENWQWLGKIPVLPDGIGNAAAPMRVIELRLDASDLISDRPSTMVFIRRIAVAPSPLPAVNTRIVA